jgi:hypothetical protein
MHIIIVFCTWLYAYIFCSDSSTEEQKIASTALENNYFDRDCDYNGDNRDNGINNANRNDIFEITRVF